ncbi:uncharacterized protein LOC133317564 isoform X2 [Gastrolobium bilobum]|uniref:uncharacterized protein LOC133317564 isoform X2 n=1 Tax=Gastrolobium bilobum TaxID=150636 RepID=UPI002AB19A39|nr:uncharacterized protein LOC133317564 isoform X2 [Gastrolobium bilobum]
MKADGRKIVLTIVEDENEERSRELIKLLKAAASANRDLIFGYVGVKQLEEFAENFDIGTKLPKMVVWNKSDDYLTVLYHLYLVDEAPNMISTLIILLSDPDSSTVTVAWVALSSVIASVPKEVLPSYIKLVCDAVSTSRDKERRKKKEACSAHPVCACT